MSTSITIKTSYGSCTVENVDDDLDLHDMMMLVVVPALLGVGYSEAELQTSTQKERDRCIKILKESSGCMEFAIKMIEESNDD